jgi:hypothetical protein
MVDVAKDEISEPTLTAKYLDIGLAFAEKGMKANSDHLKEGRIRKETEDMRQQFYRNKHRGRHRSHETRSCKIVRTDKPANKPKQRARRISYSRLRA